MLPHTIFPYISAGSVVFDAPSHHLHQEELCRGADTLWLHLLTTLPPAPSPDAVAALRFAHRLQTLRHTRLYYLRQSPDDWSVWRVECVTLPDLTELQLCPSLLHYYPDGPPPLLLLRPYWVTSPCLLENGASPSPRHTDSN